MASFSLPPVVDHSGWGPVPASAVLSAAASSSSTATTGSATERAIVGYQPVPAGAFMFAELPFQPFNKNEKLWRISDWASGKEGGGGNERWGAGGARKEASGVGIIGDDGIVGDEGEAGSFSLVDNRPKLKPRYGGNTFKRGLMGGGSAGGRGGRGGAAGAMQPGRSYRQSQGRVGRGGFQNQRGRGGQRGGRGGRGGMFNQRNFMYGDRTAADLREASVELPEEWPLVLDVDMSNLGNFVADVEEGEDLQFAGSLEPVNPRFSRVIPRQPVSLDRYNNKQYFTATTSEDPILQELKKQNVGNVYATDAILSTLMAAPRSVNSWDILVHKEGDNIYLDKRPMSRIDFVSVNENFNWQAAGGMPGVGPNPSDPSNPNAVDKDNINYVDQLAVEATAINHNFAQQLLSFPASAEKTPPHVFDQPNPFLASLHKGSEPASVAFRYRRWHLPGGVNLVARCSLNGFMERSNGENAYIVTRALNEFDSKLQGGVDWRQKLELQTGAVLAAEMKNNQYKLARWVSEATLSGADELRLGFVSRVNPKSNTKHAILMCKSYTPQSFADSVNVDRRKLWGTLAQLFVHMRGKLEDGHYCLLRDPQKNILHFHRVPADAFDHELEDLDDNASEQ